MLSRSGGDIPLTARDVKLAVLIAVFELRYGGDSIVDACLDALDVAPPNRAQEDRVISLAEIRARTLFAEAKADFVRIKPLVGQLVEALAEKDEAPPEPPAVYAVKQTDDPKACLRETWQFLTTEIRRRPALRPENNPDAVWMVARCLACGFCGVGR